MPYGGYPGSYTGTYGYPGAKTCEVSVVPGSKPQLASVPVQGGDVGLGYLHGPGYPGYQLYGPSAAPAAYAGSNTTPVYAIPRGSNILPGTISAPPSIAASNRQGPGCHLPMHASPLHPWWLLPAPLPPPDNTHLLRYTSPSRAQRYGTQVASVARDYSLRLGL